MALQRSTLEAFLKRTWAQRGLAAWLLWPLSCIFGALSAWRRLLYRLGIAKTQRLPVPVVVVGNIFVGGTGKTPLTIWLAQALRQAGLHPGVISRGYGTHNDVPHAVTAQSLAQQVGDEPLLIAYRTQCPVMVGRDRVAVAQALLAAHPEVDVIISDDGLQHYRLARDIEIILFDGRGVGNGWLLPAGPLREPVSRRRDFTVINGAPESMLLPPDAIAMRLEGLVAEPLAMMPYAQASSRTLASFSVAPTRILAAAGIGNPQRFFTLLRAAGLDFAELPLPDHYDFSDNPFAGLHADVILITEKDAVKCRQNDALRNDPRFWVVPVTAHLDGALAEQIVEKLRGHSIA
ncbi:tetraacyldisaccharide 4'-kinase [Herminiimonas sp.]|uniref:tetraacyldisaccharide 4'-kinase n=1 Tax=Herminiimonas sp. TaxID=1926289 RepID=UPI0027241D73|nr:tetraacyldisaccharide 4'-kinase [Herminiimonas sp.]MDO8306299.1 tetraacyldisaccharide 4'-kinase [Herminiimonas sp.]